MSVKGPGLRKPKLPFLGAGGIVPDLSMSKGTELEKRRVISRKK